MLIKNPTQTMTHLWVTEKSYEAHKKENCTIEDYAIMDWHRLDGPAVIFDRGAYEWWRNNLKHRIDGPAVFTREKEYMWYIDGINITSEIDRLAEEYDFDKFNINEHGQLLLSIKFDKGN